LTAYGIYDPFSAIVAQSFQARCLWLSSFCYSLAQGLPDMGLLPFISEIGVISRIRAVSKVPLIVDIDNGFGSKKHALAISERLVACGVDAVCIEDKHSPKISSLYKGGQSLLETDQFCGIIREIKRSLPSLKVLARLEGIIYGQDVDEIDERIKKCMEAGADCVVLHNVTDNIDKLRSLISQNAQVPFGIIPTKYMQKLNQLSNENIVLVIYANQLIRSCYDSMGKTVNHLCRDPSSVDSEIPSIETMKALVVRE